MQTEYIDIHTHGSFKAGIYSIRNYSAIETTDTFESRHSIGLHPYDVKEDNLACLDTLLDSLPMAIGETGLDYSRDTDKSLQIRAFQAQIALASSNKLPLIVHSVRAVEDTLSVLKSCLSPVIIHGFTGHYSTAKHFIDRGYFLSFGARTISSPKTIEALKTMPQDRIFIETDDAEIEIQQLYAIFAELLGEDLEKLKQQIYNNFTSIF